MNEGILGCHVSLLEGILLRVWLRMNAMNPFTTKHKYFMMHLT